MDCYSLPAAQRQSLAKVTAEGFPHWRTQPALHAEIADVAPTDSFEETQIITVSRDGNSYDGTLDTTYYDTGGNAYLHDTGTVHATRISVQ